MNGKDASFMYVARSRSGVGEGGRTLSGLPPKEGVTCY